MKRFVGSLAVLALATGSVPVVSAQDEAAVPELDIKVALGCAALATFFSAASEGEPEEEAFFDDRGQRWLAMAMVREGADGEVAEEKYFELIESLTTTIEGFGDDDAAIEEFLIAGVTACGTLREVHQEEFDAIDLEEEVEE